MYDGYTLAIYTTTLIYVQVQLLWTLILLWNLLLGYVSPLAQTFLFYFDLQIAILTAYLMYLPESTEHGYQTCSLLL